MAQPLTLAYANGQPIALLPAMANRHGLITGATGTGKTVTLQVLAEGFSRLGVPVFLADVKGDLSGLGAAGTPSTKLDARLAQLGIPTPAFAASPTLFWDLFAEQGHPVRATISDMGLAAKAGVGMPSWASRASSLVDGVPAAPRPLRSPFTSARKTGTPRRENPSASTCRVTVLPVPVAPVMRPWRLAMAGSRAMGWPLA
jgi:hypothetical protein